MSPEHSTIALAVKVDVVGLNGVLITPLLRGSTLKSGHDSRIGWNTAMWPVNCFDRDHRGLLAISYAGAVER